MRAAHSLGLRIPDDLALIGFDSIREALRGRVRLTTVSVPLHDLASKALDALQGWNGADKEPTTTLPTDW